MTTQTPRTWKFYVLLALWDFVGLFLVDMLIEGGYTHWILALRVDAEVYEAIEKWAADEFRSTNGQIEWILSDALKRAKRTPKKSPQKTKEEQ